MNTYEKISVICVGNRIMLDDGAGPAVYDELTSKYIFPDNVEFIDAACMTMKLLPVVEKSDYIIAVDAVDETGAEPGTVFRFHPSDIAGHGVMQSLHDMRLIDLINAAQLLGYEPDGMCFGIQVLNMTPAYVTEGLTEPVYNALPLLCDAVLAHLWELGVRFKNADGTDFVPPIPSEDVQGAPTADINQDEISFSTTVNE